MKINTSLLILATAPLSFVAAADAQVSVPALTAPIVASGTGVGLVTPAPQTAAGVINVAPTVNGVRTGTTAIVGGVRDTAQSLKPGALLPSGGTAIAPAVSADVTTAPVGVKVGARIRR